MTKNNTSIFVIAQGFYGNRTGTEIHREKVDAFLRGNMDGILDSDEVVDRKIFRVPGAEHIAIVYDQNQEDEYVNVTFPERYAENAEEYRSRTGKEMTMYVTCEIPEIGFKIHTRCFACRIDEGDELHSLEAGDYKHFIQYFA